MIVLTDVMELAYKHKQFASSTISIYAFTLNTDIDVLPQRLLAVLFGGRFTYILKYT